MTQTHKTGEGLRAVWDRLMSSWRRISGSLWFFPSVVTIGAAALAVVMIEISSLVDQKAFLHFPRIFGVTAEGSRSMLATIAGSMITVAGVTFSIMVVAVAHASTQYTPRVLRNFMGDRSSQSALGVLVGVFVYCLVVIRTIRGQGELEFVPSLAVLGAFVLAVIAVGFLMYFIHHIASTLEAGAILDGVRRETIAAVDRLFPDALGDEPPAAHELEEAAWRDAPPPRWRAIHSTRSGYIQYVDAQRLLRLAAQRTAVIRLEHQIGEFVIERTPLASIAPAQVNEELSCAVNDAVVLDTYRTVFQDAGFGVRQMVDIALKALSPGVNDTTTAASCIDYLTAVLVRIADRDIPSSHRYVDGALRLIAPGPTFDSLLDEACSELRRCASENVRILTAMARALARISAAAPTRSRNEALLRQVAPIEASAARIPLASDRTLVVAACAEAKSRIEARISACSIASRVSMR